MVNDHIASRGVAKLLTVFIGEAIEPDAHFPYQNHEKVFVFGF